MGLLLGFLVGVYLLQVQPLIAIVVQFAAVVITIIVGFQRVGAVAVNHGQRFLIGLVASHFVLAGVTLMQMRPVWVPSLIAVMIVGLALIRRRFG